MAREIDNDRVKNVKVYGNIWHEMSVEPRRVIEKMLETALCGHRNWARVDKDATGRKKWSIWHEIGRDYDEEYKIISEEEYEYIQNLQKIKKYLDKHYD